MAPELVIFDCDGVLVDSEPIAMRIFLETLAAHGCEIDMATGYRRFLGRSLASCCEELRSDFGVDLDAAALGAMRAALYDGFRAGLRPIPGVEAVLTALRDGGVRFCVASSSQLERVELSLGLTGLAPRFAGRMFSATMVARGKPAPDLFLHAARALGAEPARCLVVEDSGAGVRAAQAAGMAVVGFTGGGHAGAAGLDTTMTALAPDATIARMEDLPRLVLGWQD